MFWKSVSLTAFRSSITTTTVKGCFKHAVLFYLLCTWYYCIKWRIFMDGKKLNLQVYYCLITEHGNKFQWCFTLFLKTFWSKKAVSEEFSPWRIKIMSNEWTLSDIHSSKQSLLSPVLFLCFSVILNFISICFAFVLNYLIVFLICNTGIFL